MFDLELGPVEIVNGFGRAAGVYINVKDGTIAAMSKEKLGMAREYKDTGGLTALPGMVDEHVHFMDPGETHREDFIRGSSAAAVGGVTTVIEHTHGQPVRDVEVLKDKAAYLRNRALVDYGLAAHVWPEDIPHIAELWHAGVMFFKVFTASTHGVPGLTSDELMQAFSKMAAAGARTLVHCEDESILAGNRKRLGEEGRSDNQVILDWRSREAEQMAVLATAYLVERTGVTATLAHVSHPQVVALANHFRQTFSGTLRLEICPQYLALDEEDVRQWGSLRKFTPPPRGAEERKGLWSLVRSGEIFSLATDHAPSTREQKMAGTVWDAPFGLPGVETTLPVMLDFVARGFLSLERLVQLYSTNPAKAWGLFPRKGVLAVGSQADIVLVDEKKSWEIRDDLIISKAGWTPYAGRHVTGWVHQTYCRGILAAEDRRICGEPGIGRWVKPL